MILKWIFDRTVALLGLLVLWPVILITAILVKLKMPGGPAFFVQKRVGKNGKLFKVGFCLPAGPYVSDDDVRYIVDSIKEAVVK